jgi:predicted dehydrogenase
MRVAVLGTGLQAKRRIEALRQCGDELVYVGSSNEKRALDFAHSLNVASAGLYSDFLDTRPDAVIITSTPDQHYQLSEQCILEGIPFICEKPLTRSSESAAALEKLARENHVLGMVGFNHRFHTCFQQAFNCEKDQLGKLLELNCYYGICGRPDYSNEWRSDENVAAGGILMELGIHLVDLARWFAGPFEKGICVARNNFFQTEPLEDSGSATIISRSGVLISIRTNIISWKNTFWFEAIFEDGYIHVDGLGQSYGLQKLIVGKKHYSDPFNFHVTEFRGSDVSWRNEWENFRKKVQSDEKTNNIQDGVAAMSVIEELYKSSSSEKFESFTIG